MASQNISIQEALHLLESRYAFKLNQNDEKPFQAITDLSKYLHGCLKEAGCPLSFGGANIDLDAAVSSDFLILFLMASNRINEIIFGESGFWNQFQLARGDGDLFGVHVEMNGVDRASTVILRPYLRLIVQYLAWVATRNKSAIDLNIFSRPWFYSHLIVFHGNPDLLKRFMDVDRSICDPVSSRDEHGNTPLHIACLRNNECIHVLVKSGADLDVKNSSDQTPIDLLHLSLLTSRETIKQETGLNALTEDKPSASCNVFEKTFQSESEVQADEEMKYRLMRKVVDDLLKMWEQMGERILADSSGTLESAEALALESASVVQPRSVAIFREVFSNSKLDPMETAIAALVLYAQEVAREDAEKALFMPPRAGGRPMRDSEFEEEDDFDLLPADEDDLLFGGEVIGEENDPILESLLEDLLRNGTDIGSLMADCQLGEPLSQPKPSIRVINRIEPSEDRYVKSILQEFNFMVDRDMELVLTPDLDYLSTQLELEFPWFSPITHWIVQQLAARRHGDNVLTFPPLLLLGAPGIGKTSYIQRLGELAKVPFKLLNLGGMHDSKTLEGTSRGWSSGQPSPILFVLRQHQRANPLILLDEIDKAGGSDHNGRPFDTLLTLLEPSSNHAVYDSFLMGSANLSYVNYVASANDHRWIPNTLLSRFTILRVSNPKPDHYRGIVERCIIRFAQTRGIHRGWIEPFSPGEWKWLARYFQNPRQARMAVETLLSHKLSEIPPAIRRN